MNIDLATGLPELPEGHFWRVAHPLEAWGFGECDHARLQVELRVTTTVTSQVKTGRFFGEWMTVQKESSSVVVTENCDGTSPADVLEAARRAMENFEARQAAHALVGDYPPKQLGAVA